MLTDVVSVRPAARELRRVRSHVQPHGRQFHGRHTAGSRGWLDQGDGASLENAFQVFCWKSNLRDVEDVCSLIILPKLSFYFDSYVTQIKFKMSSFYVFSKYSINVTCWSCKACSASCSPWWFTKQFWLILRRAHKQCVLSTLQNNIQYRVF